MAVARNGFVLVVGDDGGVLVHLVKGRVREALYCPVPGEDGDGPEHLRPYLRRHGRVPVHVLLDVHELMLRDETLPRTNPLDRAKVVRRRLDLAFPDMRLKAALPVPGGARGEMLFCAVPEVPPLSDWLAFLATLPNPVAGIALLPLEARGMLAGLCGGGGRRRRGDGDGGTRWRILVSREVTGGFRQIVERDGRMLVTRLTPPPAEEDDAREIAADIEREFRSTISYIKRMGYQDGAPLDLVVLGPVAVGEALAALDLPARLLPLTPAEAGRRLRLPKVGPEETPYADVLHALWFARRRRAMLTLHTPATRRRLMLSHAERHVPLTGVAAALAAALYVGDLAYRHLDALDAVTAREAQLAQARRERQEIERAFEDVPVSFERMQEVISLHDRLRAQAPDLVSLVEALAGGLGAEARLTRLEVQVEDRESSQRGRRRAAAAAGLLPHSIRLEVELLGTDGVPERATAATMALRDRLARQFPGYGIAFEGLPVNVLPERTLSGRLDVERGLAEINPNAGLVLSWDGEGRS